MLREAFAILIQGIEIVHFDSFTGMAAKRTLWIVSLYLYLVKLILTIGEIQQDLDSMRICTDKSRPNILKKLSGLVAVVNW